MEEKNNIKSNSSKNLKIFFIKLISISIGVIIVVNLIFNLIFAERLERIDKILMLDRGDVRQNMKDKIRNELEDALKKDNILYEKDKILLYKLYKKIKEEFLSIDKSKL